jgi:hypothetical protein
MLKPKFIPDDQFWSNNGILFPEVKVSGTHYDWSNYNKLEDFQRFVDYFSDTITCMSDLISFGPALYLRLTKLGFRDDIKFKYRRVDLSIKKNFNTIKDFQNFIDTHEDIIVPSDLMKKYQKIYARAAKLGYLSQLKYKSRIYNNIPYKTTEEFQNFIDSHPDITKPEDFKRNYPGVYGKMVNKKLANTVRYKNKRASYLEYKTIDDIQKFIDTHQNITNSKIFRLQYSGLYDIACSLGITRQLKYKESFKITHWEDFINSVDDVINYIITHKIENMTELTKSYRGLAHRIHKLGICAKEYNAYFLNPHKSWMEIQTEKFLNKVGINYEYQATFIETGALRFDFWLPDHNLMLEPGGEQHIIPVDRFGGEPTFQRIIKNDGLKRDYCTEKNIKILYWFKASRPKGRELMIKALQDNGYPGEYHLTFSDFKSRILELTGRN